VLYDGYLLGELSFPDLHGEGTPAIWTAWKQLEGTWFDGLERLDDGTYDFYHHVSYGTYRFWWADLDGDARDDLIVCPGDECPLGLLSQAGVPSNPLPLELTESLVELFDVTGDGVADAFTQASGALHVWEGDGQGGFSMLDEVQLPPGNKSIHASRSDVRSFAVHSRCADCASVIVFRLGTDRAIVPVASSEALEQAKVVEVGLIDGDDRADLIVEHTLQQGTRVLDVLLAREGGALVSALRLHDVEAAAAGPFGDEDRIDLMWKSHGQTHVLAGALDPRHIRAVDVDLLPPWFADSGGRLSDRVVDLDDDGRAEIVQYRWMEESDHGQLEAIEQVDCE
jgi:hypothetical protein